MTRIWRLVILTVSMVTFAGCGENAKVTTELQQLQARNASSDQVRASLISHDAGNGRQVQGREAEDLIRHFCGKQDAVKGLQFLKAHAKVMFFSTPDMTIFTFFSSDDKFKEFLIGTQ